MIAPVYRFGDYRLDVAKRELTRGDALVELPPRVFACLVHLIERRDRAVDRAELIRALWRRDNVSDTQLFQLVLRARRAVGDDADSQQAIRTIVGFGYRWVAPTEVDAPAPPPDVPASALPTLESTPQPPQTGAASRQRGVLSWIVVAALAAFAAAAWFATREQPGPVVSETSGEPRLAVAPLALAAGAPADAAWVRYGGMDLVADRLRRAGLVVQTSEATLGAMTAGGDAHAADALRRGGAIGLVVTGEVALRDDRWQVVLRADRAGAGPLRGEAADADPMLALRAASDALIRALGRGAPTDAVDAPAARLLQEARAAMLADDPKTAAAVLDRAPAALANDPELRLMRAQVAARLGRYADAQALATALVEAPGADPFVAMRALIVRGAAFIPLGDAARARADFDAALATPGAEGHAHARGDAYAGRGATGTMRDDFAAAAADLGQARVLLDQSGDALGVARVDLEWALLDHARGAATPAMTRFAEAARQFETLAAKRPLKSALVGLEDVQYDQLQIGAALATSDRAWAASDGGGDPLLRRVIAIQRVKILIAAGRLADAQAVFAAIEAGSLDYLAESRDDVRLRLARTELALRDGRAADAAREARLLPDGVWPDGSDDVLAAKATLWRRRALPDEAVPPPVAPRDAGPDNAASDNPGGRAAAPYRALAEAERLARAERVADADRAYQEALRRADDAGPFTLKTVVASYVPFLLDAGRTADAATLAARVAVWASEDYDAALVRLAVAHAHGERTAWQSALDGARRLAGERRVPAELAAPPASH